MGNNPINWRDPLGLTKVDMNFEEADSGVLVQTVGFTGTYNSIVGPTDLLSQVSAKLRRPIDRHGRCYDCLRNLTISGHGGQGQAYFGNDARAAALPTGRVRYTEGVLEMLQGLRQFFCVDGKITIDQCSTGRGRTGRILLDAIATITDVRVRAPMSSIYGFCGGAGTFTRYRTGYPPPYVPRGVCFVAGTLVSTPNGEVPIETLEVGDEVLARDMETGKTAAYPITALIRNHRADLCEVRMVDGDSVTASTNHRFFVVGKGWTDAMELNRGDLLLMQGGAHIRVDDRVCRVEPNPVPVFNLTVGVAHTYFVGPQRILVHNRKLR